MLRPAHPLDQPLLQGAQELGLDTRAASSPTSSRKSVPPLSRLELPDPLLRPRR